MIICSTRYTIVHPGALEHSAVKGVIERFSCDRNPHSACLARMIVNCKGLQRLPLVCKRIPSPFFPVASEALARKFISKIVRCSSLTDHSEKHSITPHRVQRACFANQALEVIIRPGNCWSPVESTHIVCIKARARCCAVIEILDSCVIIWLRKIFTSIHWGQKEKEKGGG